MSADELIKNIDWSELRNQKRTLLGVIDKHYNNIAGETLKDNSKDDLIGLLHLIDKLQDYACDELNIPSIHIYDFEDEENMEKVELLLNKKRKPMECGDVLIPVNELKDIEFTPESKNLLISIINHFGNGQHPNCDEQTFNYFQIEYVKDIINEYDEKISKKLNNIGNVLFNSIKKTLGIL